MVIHYSRRKSVLSLCLALFFGIPLNFVFLIYMFGLWSMIANESIWFVLWLLFILGIPTLATNMIIFVSLQRLLFNVTAFEVTDREFIVHLGIIRRKKLAIPLEDIALVSLEHTSLGASFSRLFGLKSTSGIRSVGKALQVVEGSKLSSDMVLSETYLHLCILFHMAEKAVYYSRLYGVRLKTLLDYALETGILEIEPGPIETVNEKDLMNFIEKMKSNHLIS